MCTGASNRLRLWALAVTLGPLLCWGQGPAYRPRLVQLGGVRFEQRAVGTYAFDPTVTAVALVCRYGQGHYLNPTAWDGRRLERRITAVELVYSAHPPDTSAWLTPYSALLTARLQALQSLEPRLADTAYARRVRFSLVVQTAAPSRVAAEGLFHGAIIHYVTEPERAQPGSRAHVDAELERVRRIVGGKEPLADSTLLQLVARRPDWRQQAVVMDWTGSMYPHGASLIRALWLLGRQDLLGALALFNDGDDFVHGVALRRKPVGKTGGIYECPDPSRLDELLLTMAEVMEAGDGGEPAENDLEALLWMQRRYAHYGRLVLLGDNRSAVRDLELLPQLRLPVDVVACDATLMERRRGSRAPRRPQPNLHLLTIAWFTGGSFTLGDEQVSFERARAEGVWTVAGLRVASAGDRLVPSPEKPRAR